MAWPTDLTQLMKRISTPAEETFQGLEVLGDYLKTSMDAQDATIKLYLRNLMWAGNIFWVNGIDGVGSNANAGTTRAAPFLTLTYALSQCVDNQNDIIFVEDYWQPAGEAWPIHVNKQQVHIVGMAQRGLPFPAIHPSTDVAAFHLCSSGQYGSIENLTIGGGSAHGGIEWGVADGQVDGFLIKKCTFGHPWFGTPLNGIRQDGAATRGGYGNRIEKCTFLSDLAGETGAHLGAITGNAIAQLSTVLPFHDTEIVDNVFKGCQRAINLLYTKDAVIEENRFTVPDAASDGESIWLAAACFGIMVNNNWSFKGNGAALGFNPYYDAGNNHWGLNYRQGVSVMPA